MNITITPTRLQGQITPPPSKSQAHRCIIAAALADGVSVLSNVGRCADVDATVACLEELGAQFDWEGTTLTVTGMGASQMSPMRRMAIPRMDCGESGSTLRFLIPVALAVRAGGVFTGHGRLMERPLKPYFDLFDEKGVFYEQKGDTLTVRGLLEPGAYRLPGNVSSQFFTGLMFALPLLRGDSDIVLTSELESGDYVEMTREAMADAGVLTQAGHIPGGQTYRPFRKTIEADWSQAAFFYAAHGLGNDILVGGLNPFSLQGDTRIVPYYMELCSAEGDVVLDVSQCPDLFPALALLGALRAGKTTHIGGGARLRMKESDRIAAVSKALTAFGVEVEQFTDGVALAGVGTLKGNVTIDCCGDHRIAMMAAVAATRADGPVTLLGAECVSKSYPGFWEDYRSLGGQFACTEE